MDPKEAQLLEAEIKQEALLHNPFPGLRPFTIDECHLFFGRESQVDEILVNLAENRFVATLGFSGSGKSSIMYCGLIPILYGGFMTEAGPNWNVITTRPGESPINNLSEAILSQDQEYVEASEEEQLINRTIISSILRSGSRGLIDVAKKYKLSTGDNLLILVDQFEEIFRFRRNETIPDSHDEALAFTNLILEAVKQDEVPIYIAITMRSDYIGECSLFPGLTEMINNSNYLVPQMNRDHLRMAIEGPVAVGGGRISDRLVKRLLSEVGDNQDQLPILQHALMRTWDYWVENKDIGEYIDVRHYNAVGRMTQALSQHANEAYDELNDKQKMISEVLFKALTEKRSATHGIRRPAKLGTVAEIAGVDEQEVMDVVEAFRKPGRSLIMPSTNVPLTADTVLEISHESLMRIWIRLKNWSDEEFESAQMYKRLSEAAAMYQIGRTGLWRPPDLQMALNWQKKQKPTRVWAQRYDEAFERAIVFLDTSRITYEAEQRNQEMMQKRLLRRTRLTAAVLGIAAVIAIVLFIFAITQQIEAQKQRDEAIIARNEAVVARQAAEEAQARAEASEQAAIEAKAEADRQRLLTEAALEQARVNLREANRQRRIADEQRLIAVQQRDIADSARLVAEREFLRAERNYNDAQRLLFLTIAQSMAVKSLQITDPNLKGLLAQQAYLFNTQYDGREYDNYIYDGLYWATREIEGEEYNVFKGHRNAVKSIVFAKAGTQFYSSGSDGRILQWDLAKEPEEYEYVAANTYSNRMIKVSDNNQWLLNTSDSTFVQVFNLQSGADPVRVDGHLGLVLDMEFLPDNSGFISLGSDRTLRQSDFRSSRQVRQLENALKVLDISPDGSKLAGGTYDGKVVLIDTQSFQETVLFESDPAIIHAIKFSTDGNLISFGDETGMVKVWDLSAGQITFELTGFTSRVSDIEFSADGNLMAASSFDGKIQIWITENLDELPMILNDHKDAYVWDIAFSEDGNYLVAGTDEDEIKMWPTKLDMLANMLCERLERNMTEKEWNRYVGNGIDYRTTCATESASGL